MMYKKSIFIILFPFLLQGCASNNTNSCSTTRLVTPIVVAAQMHINIITKQNVIVRPDC